MYRRVGRVGVGVGVGELTTNSLNESTFIRIFTYLFLVHQPAVCIDTSNSKTSECRARRRRYRTVPDDECGTETAAPPGR